MANDGEGCVAAVLLVTLSIAIAFGAWRYWGADNGRRIGIEEVRQEAVDHNAAEYVCDPATGAVEFRWKEGK